MRAPGTARERLHLGLDAATLEEGLRRVIVFDPAPAELQAAAEEWARRLATVTGASVSIVWLGSTEGDDEIWGRPGLRRGPEGGLTLGWRPGRLYPQTGEMRIVVIRDLARLSVAAARAFMSLAEAEVAELARHGRHDRWSPALAWIAGLRREEAGDVSPHLLDRFPLRLQGSAADSPRNTLPGPAHTGHAAAPSVPDRYAALRIAARQHPYFAPDVLAAVGTYVPQSSEGIRREVALARVARALGRLEGATLIRPDHLAAAARFLGLTATTLPAASQPPEERPDLPASAPLTSLPRDRAPGASGAPSLTLEGPGEEVGVGQPSELESLSIPPSPYAEDEQPTRREAVLLHLSGRAEDRVTGRGPVIGTEAATGLNDLAIVETLREALKHRSLRRARGKPRPLVRRADLRAHRRAPLPGHLLVLAIDFTVRRTRPWDDALVPHLAWAYLNRARICVVRIGAADAMSALRAELVEARNLLSPTLAVALSGEPGNSTPLAHGLDLVLRRIRPALRRGRERRPSVRFVLLTDGRGNIPLAASLTADPPRRAVRDRGVRDALLVASEIGRLHGLEIAVLDPCSPGYLDLPTRLAQVLGASVQGIDGQAR